jgi:hypothetical protein
MNVPLQPETSGLSNPSHFDRIRLGFFFVYAALHFAWISLLLPDTLGTAAVPLAFLIAWLTMRVEAVWTLVSLATLLAIGIGFRNPNVTLGTSVTLALLGLALFSVRNLAESLMRALGGRTVSDENSILLSRVLVRWFLDIGMTITLVAICVFIAVVLLAWSPYGSGQNFWFQWTLDNKQAFWPGGTLIVVLLAFGVVTNELRWRRKTREQARLYVRAERVRWQFLDLAAIAKRQRKSSKEPSR